jgi:hypothetical protein
MFSRITMRYILRRALEILGFSSPDRSLDTRETLALGHLTVVALLRVLVAVGASARFAVHHDRYLADPGRLALLAVVLGGFVLYTGAVFALRAFRRRWFLAEPVQWAEMVLDVAFLSGLYYLTGNEESDFFLFFAIPLMLPTTMDWRFKSWASLLLAGGALLALVLVMPGPPGAEAQAWYKDLLRVFAPRLVFMAGVWLSVNVMMEYRRDAADEQGEKRALQEMLDRMRRAAEAPAPAAPPPGGNGRLGPGRVVGGRYEVLQSIGRGGMGEVFQARDLEIDDVVALKVLSEGPRNGDATIGLASLRQEIRTARRITHPNVVRVHDLQDMEGVRFLTMEYVPGTTLKALFGRRGALPLGPGLQVFKQLLSGLGAVHKAGILHRDLKPENVMVLPNGMVKLMDFGLAQVAAEGQGDGKFVVGSPYYMSPEQLKSEPMDPRSDLYAVGVLMFEAFTGRHPFPAASLREVIEHHAFTPPPRPGEVDGANVPGPLEDLILACLAKDPAARPASATAVYAALLGAGGGS